MSLPGDLNVLTHNPDYPIATKEDFEEFKGFFSQTEGWIESYKDEHTHVHFKNVCCVASLPPCHARAMA